jgi:O-methyltransferase
LDFEFNIDACSADGIVGWVIHESGVEEIRARIEDSPIGQVTSGINRADVARPRPNTAGALRSGFTITFPEGTLRDGEPPTATIEFIAGDGTVERLERRIWPVRLESGSAIRTDVGPSPLPADVVATLSDLRPQIYAMVAQWVPEIVEQAVADIVDILKNRAIVKPILRYAHFLQSMSACFGFIVSHFDRINRLAKSSAKDSEAVGTSIDEMICIANHLYVLQSRGLAGDMVECGCFKGFSTCCLSQACAWLGITLHVFDSFAGLPASADDYYNEGEFRGTVDEVTDNVLTFGRPSMVRLHEGFFSETVPKFREPVMCIWMDVDLESSSRDVMGLLPALLAGSCVFTHECPPDAFVDGKPQPTATEVMPPIIEAFSTNRIEPVGRHLVGFLGAVWAADRGVPVLGHGEIARIVRAANLL